MIEVLVKFPTRERPGSFAKALGLLVSEARHSSRIHYLFTLDENDPSLWHNQEVISRAGIAKENYTVVVGRSKGKIDAVNRDLSAFDKQWRTVLVASDDMHATQWWDVWVMQAMAQFYPATDGCLWFSDGFQHDICTIPCIGKAMYDALGYIYNPIYQSVFADDEQTHRAIKDGKITRLDNILMRHDHPAWNSSLKPDALYRRNETREIWDKDEATYRERLNAGFP
jgi:hypothetical protein